MDGEMNWFERHLNRTVALIWWAQAVLMIIAVVAPFIPKIAGWSSAEPEFGMVNDIIFWVALFITLGLKLFVEGWALRKKDRSLGWLFVVYITPYPFGLLIFCQIRDNSKAASQRQQW